MRANGVVRCVTRGKTREPVGWLRSPHGSGTRGEPMRALRCATVAAVALTLILPASAAHAQPAPPRTTVVVTPGNLQGWIIDKSAPRYTFTTERRTIGTGSLQFEAIPPGP